MSARAYFAWKMCQSARSQDDRNYNAHLRTKLRKIVNPLHDLSEEEFRLQYRLSKTAFICLCKDLRRLTFLRGSQRVTLETKVLTALFFFASGSYQRPIGVAKNVSQKMCSIYIQEVVEALIHPPMMNKYICFPTTPSARQAVSYKFYTKFGFPGVIGCIDGSHFKIFKPFAHEEHLYYSRKHYHSLNVQMVCDSDCRILSLNPKFGGANHDCFVWENSNLNSYMQSLHRNGEIVWLLGDSGYPQRPWIMTPIADASPNSPEANYNNRHLKTRVLIENTFGRLKNRWRCLNKDRVLHYAPLKCAKIIQACSVLYNLALDLNVPEPEGHIERNEDTQQESEVVENTSTLLIRGRVLRAQLVRRLHAYVE